MNPSFRFEAESVSDLQVLWEDGERVFCRGWRADSDTGRSAALAVLPAAEYAPQAVLDRLAHEYELRDELDAAWAARPLALISERARTALLLEDSGGEPLDRFIGAPMKVERFLRLAIGIVAALAKAHQRGLVHKDVKPANILVNCADGLTRLTGFGIASRVPRERQAPEPPEVIAGTLAYMAPEQTGRMNRSIDSRSDLYALGVTFYQMLTGRLPFTASEPMEWVHCHIARRPLPPDERVPEMPAALSAIVMKLLAKTAEERYQTAAGVEHDLRRCLAEWERYGRIEPFALGERDRPNVLMIPEKLYGREREIEALLAAFDRVVASGAPELVLVSGYSGIGKSAIVNELHKVLVPPRGLFASGKFDQYKRDIPYATLAQAFQGLIRPLLGKSEVELAPWRAALAEALGPNGQLMVTLIPELEPLIGPQPPAPELPPQDAQRRFQLVFRRLLGVFARPEHPLALFLDDLQWLDAGTLGLLEHLATQPELRHLLLVGAYRDNEVTPRHPLTQRLTAIRSAGGRLQEIVLAPLGFDDIGRLIADALQCAPARAVPLTRLVQEKTAGNPFFTNQFLTALAEEGLLAVDHGVEHWVWDVDRIRAKGYTDNVVELMVGKVRRLPAATQVALQQLACLGNSAPISTLGLVQGVSEAALDAAFWEAARAGLVLRQEGSYRFLHDRVQEAAYALIPEGERPAAHLATGRLLAAATPEAIEDNVFEIVSQLNRGAALITSAEEREWLAELNLIAGRRAKVSTAYASALTYVVAGRALLPEDVWERRYELIFALELQRAECEFLTGKPAEAEARLAELARRAASFPDLAAVTQLRVELFTNLDQRDRVVEVGLEYLHRVGIEWSAHPTHEEVRQEYKRLWRQMGERPIEALLDLPRMDDAVARGTMNVLTVVLTAVIVTNVNLTCLITGRMANLSLEHGNSDGSCLAYVGLGVVLGPYFGDYKTAYRFGQLGLDLVEKRGLDRFKGLVYVVFGGLVNPWTRHVRTGRPLLRRVFDAAQEVGDLNCAVYSYLHLVPHLLASGDPLREVQREAETGLEFVRQARFGHAVRTITSQLQLIRTLRGLTPGFGSFDDSGFDEEQFERHFEQDARMVISACRYWVRKLQARLFAGDYAGAIAAAAHAEPSIWASVGFFDQAEYRYYAALAHSALCDTASAAERVQHREALAAHHRQLQEWAENCPENFENRAALVGAEIARLDGREFDAQRLFEQAIQSAHANGFVYNEALASEVAARFYAAHGLETNAQAHLRNARHCYLRWGADGKVRRLDQLHPHLREEERPAGPIGTIGAPVEQLDLATVIKVSQAVSGEIVLETLIDTLMRTAIEQAGAERGLLILPRGGDLRIVAEATTGGDTVLVHLCDQRVMTEALPESVLHYVLRTQESVILDDAATEFAFAADSYIRQRQVRSILCLPLINQTKLTGVLYLENNLARSVFAPTRMAVLKLLASQAAIALENTYLYRDLAEREAKIRRLVDANIIGLGIWNSEGQILEANDAFLRIGGYDREDLASGRLHWTDLTPPEWRDRSEEAIQELRMTGTAQPYEKEYFRKDGSRVSVLIGSASFEEGASQGVSFVLDLTERKQAEAALRASEEQWKAVFENNPTMYFMVDSAGTILSVNPFGADKLGYTTDDLIGRPVEILFHEADRDHARRNKAICFEHLGRTMSWELRKLRKDGEALWVRETARALSIKNRPTLLVVSEDITEGKRAAEALREVQMQLSHANRVATMGQLTASIAHEVNQPIAATLTNAQACLRWLVAEPPNLDEVRQALGRIVRDANRASAVVHRIRNLSKKVTSRTDRVEINAAIREVIEITRSESMKSGVLVTADLAEGLPPIPGDRVELQQVILNLMLNALEAMSGMSEGQRELQIRARTTELGDVLVAVRDSGPGLAPAALEHLFEAFHTTKPNGLGLGLSICRSIIEAHGGRLWASTNEPRGAIFQFTLPAPGM